METRGRKCKEPLQVPECPGPEATDKEKEEYAAAVQRYGKCMYQRQYYQRRKKIKAESAASAETEQSKQLEECRARIAGLEDAIVKQKELIDRLLAART